MRHKHPGRANAAISERNRVCGFSASEEGDRRVSSVGSLSAEAHVSQGREQFDTRRPVGLPFERSAKAIKKFKGLGFLPPHASDYDTHEWLLRMSPG